MTTPFVIPPWAQPRSCYTVLVTPAAEEPLTVAEAKLLAAMSWPVTVPPDPREAMVADFIRAAREKVEKDTGLALLTQVRDVHVMIETDWVPLPSQCTPVQSIVDVTPVVNPLPEPDQPRHGRIIPAPRLASRGGVTGFAFEQEFATPYTVLRVTAGWPDAATLKAAEPLLHHCVGLLTSHYLTLGRDMAITGAVASINVVPEGYEDSIQPYRLIWVT
jgi:hypothetical protein